MLGAFGSVTHTGVRRDLAVEQSIINRALGLLLPPAWQTGAVIVVTYATSRRPWSVVVSCNEFANYEALNRRFQVSNLDHYILLAQPTWEDRAAPLTYAPWPVKLVFRWNLYL